MKTLLVPTDFSDNARTALRFACLLAGSDPTQLILLHAYHPEIPVADIPYHLLMTEEKERRGEMIARLHADYSEFTPSTNINISCLAIEGLAVDAIVEAAEKYNPDYVVMGTKGKSNAMDVLFGSITSRVIERASVPVIAVPPGSQFTRPIQKITYATNYHRSDIPALAKISEMAVLFNAAVTVLHISPDHESPEDQLTLMKKFKRKVMERLSGQASSISFGLLQGSDTEKQLKKYLSENKADLLVMSTHVRSLLDHLFEKSITKHIVLHSEVPVIAFHYNQHTAVTLY